MSTANVYYVVTLYVTGGEHDAESFVCGPFEEEREAVAVSSDLQLHGMTDVLRLYPTVGDVETALS